MRLAERSASTPQRPALFYALLLKDAGCSTNAAKIAELYGADDHAVKRDAHADRPPRAASLAPRGATSRPAPGRSRARHCAPSSRRAARRAADDGCAASAVPTSRGASDSTRAPPRRSAPRRALGRPRPPGGLAGEEISLPGAHRSASRRHGGLLAGRRPRRGAGTRPPPARHWFDPALVDALRGLEHDTPSGPRSSGAARHRARARRPRRSADDAAWTASPRRSPASSTPSRPTPAATRAASPRSPSAWPSAGPRRRPAGTCAAPALLHDIGKLGVSNLILDKPGKLTDAEWAAVRATRAVAADPRGVAGVRPPRPVSPAHHERLDGSGYPAGSTARHLDLPARILASRTSPRR